METITRENWKQHVKDGIQLIERPLRRFIEIREPDEATMSFTIHNESKVVEVQYFSTQREALDSESVQASEQVEAIDEWLDKPVLRITGPNESHGVIAKSFSRIGKDDSDTLVESVNRKLTALAMVG